MESAIAAAGFGGQGDQLARLGGGEGQRLLAQDVFAGLKGVGGHGQMQRIGGADMDDVHGGIFQDAAVIGVGSFDVELAAQAGRIVALGDHQRVDFHVAQAPQAFNVYTADEAGAEDGCFETSHIAFPGRARPGAPRMLRFARR